ncbi:MAG: indole-3-glycerol phosphate synthase TrpC [Candidatus Margulisiibacteriota bacterium]
MSILDKILDQKKHEIKKLSYEDLIPNEDNNRKSLLSYLENKRLNLIAEVKQASPSKGVIYSDFNPLQLAKLFQENGASCISVLTDEMFFQGSKSYLTAIKSNTHIPILRKDFILDPIQVKETNSIGADVMLLILDILDINQCNELISAATTYNIEVLIEIHSYEALSKLNQIKFKPIVGVNNRDLKTFKCDTNRALEMAKEIKLMAPEIKVIAESGYSQPNEMDLLEKKGINGVLIGEGLSKNNELLEWFKQ